MRSRAGFAIVCWTAAALVASGFVRTSAQQPATPLAPAVAPPATHNVVPSPEQALLNRYCIGCHNQRTRTANLALDTLDVTNVGAHPAAWEKVARKLRAGVMPPSGLPRPDVLIA